MRSRAPRGLKRFITAKIAGFITTKIAAHHIEFSQTRDSQSCLKMCERLRTSSIPLIPAVIRFCTWVDDA